MHTHIRTHINTQKTHAYIKTERESDESKEFVLQVFWYKHLALILFFSHALPSKKTFYQIEIQLSKSILSQI